MSKHTYIVVTSPYVDHGITTAPTILKIETDLQVHTEDIIMYLTNHCGYDEFRDRVQIELVKDIPTLTSVSDLLLDPK
jgi:hypothetical protein